jgi:hypothetical protein
MDGFQTAVFILGWWRTDELFIYHRVGGASSVLSRTIRTIDHYFQWISTYQSQHILQSFG